MKPLQASTWNQGQRDQVLKFEQAEPEPIGYFVTFSRPSDKSAETAD
jgi:hypothetical protein